MAAGATEAVKCGPDVAVGIGAGFLPGAALAADVAFLSPVGPAVGMTRAGLLNFLTAGFAFLASVFTGLAFPVIDDPQVSQVSGLPVMQPHRGHWYFITYPIGKIACYTCGMSEEWASFCGASHSR